MSAHVTAIKFLKGEINRLVSRIVEIDNQIQPLLDEKTELDLMAKEIEGSILTLNGDKTNETQLETSSAQ